MGLILLILWLIIKLESKPITKAKTNIGRRLIGLKENVKPMSNDRPISRLATKDITTNSKDATKKETMHCSNEWT